MTTAEKNTDSGGDYRRWAVFGLLLVAGFAWTVYDLGRGLLAQDHLVFGLLITAAAFFLAWERRERIRQARFGSSPLGWVLIGFSVVAYLVGSRAAVVFPGGMTSVFVRFLSLLSFLAGAGLVLLGREVMRPLWLPGILLLFAVPQSFLTASWLPLRLQTIATVLSHGTASLLGMEVMREGHELHTSSFSANVAEACSGIRSLTAIIPAALYLAGTGLKRPGPKLVLIVLAIPVAVVANSFRITTTLVLGTYVAPEMAHGFFHNFAGLGIFILSLGCLFLCLSMLKSAEGPDQKEQDKGDEKTEAGWDLAEIPQLHSMSFVSLLVLLGIFTLFQISQAYAYHVVPQQAEFPESPLASVPMTIGRWEGKQGEITDEVHRVRSPSDIISRSYHKNGAPPVAVTVLYWKPGADPERLNLSHSVEICGPAHGMRRTWRRDLTLDVGQKQSRTVQARIEQYTAPDRGMIVTSLETVGRTPLDASAYRNFQGVRAKAVFGLKMLWAGPHTSAPSIAFQFSTPQGNTSDEAIISAQRELAQRIVRQTWASIYEERKAGGDLAGR